MSPFQLDRRASELKDWLVTIGSDPAALLIGVGVLFGIVVVVSALLASWARRRRERRRVAEWWMTPESAERVGVGRWVEEGRQLLTDWQARIERLDELQRRLAEMAHEIGQLRAQVGRMDELRAENLRLSQEAEAVSLEREQLRAVLARIGELIQRASETRPRAAGDATH